MQGYTVVTCPLCGKKRYYEGTAPQDRLVKAVGAHVLTEHPGTPPMEADDLIERAVAGIDVAELDPSEVETGGWVRVDD